MPKPKVIAASAKHNFEIKFDNDSDRFYNPYIRKNPYRIEEMKIYQKKALAQKRKVLQGKVFISFILKVICSGFYRVNCFSNL